MRAFTKSILSYTWSSSLFGLQEMTRFLTPQGWLQTGQSAKSFERITKAYTDELGSIAGSTFRFADNLQRGSVDLMFTVFTLGLLDRNGKGSSQSGSATAPATAPGSGAVSNLGGQAVSFLCQGLEVLGQTAGIVGQAMGGVLPSTGCGSCSSAETGWGPVKPPAGG